MIAPQSLFDKPRKRGRHKSAFSIRVNGYVLAVVAGLGTALSPVVQSDEQSLLPQTEFSPQDKHYQIIMRRANHALMRRETNQALSLYEQAATQFGEKPDAELAKVRAHLLGGSFREALAFANLVAGEHSDFPPAIALLAFIEDRSGHTERAIERLEAALKRWPQSQALRAALAEVLIDRGSEAKAIVLMDEWIDGRSADTDIFRLRARAAMRTGDTQGVIDWRSRAVNGYTESGRSSPSQLISSSGELGSFTSELAGGEQISDHWPPPAFEQWPATNIDSVKLGNGLVINDGEKVITSAAVAARIGSQAYVRNGLGLIRKAIVESRDDMTGLAVLRLDVPYETKSSITPATIKTPKPGSFCFTLGFPVVGDIDGNYPVLSQGIVVRTKLGSAGLTQFTAWLSTDQRGAPLFDSAGNLIGIYGGTGDQIEAARRDQLGNANFAVKADAVFAPAPERSEPLTPPGMATMPLSSDELYEKLLPVVVSIVISE